MRTLLGLALLSISSVSLAATWGPARLLEFATATCRDWNATAEPTAGFAAGSVLNPR